MQRLPICFCAALALACAGCNKPAPVSLPAAPSPVPTVATPAPTPAPSPTATPPPQATPPPAAEGTKNVRFGDKFQLDGAFVSREGDAARLALNWESLSGEPLGYTLSVQVVNESGDILNQTDHPQDASGRQVKSGEAWKESILLTPEQLKGGNAVAICLYHPGSDILKADRGKRDWNNVRLWIALGR